MEPEVSLHKCCHHCRPQGHVPHTKECPEEDELLEKRLDDVTQAYELGKKHGKEYWEPSEHHKSLWHAEGAKAEALVWRTAVEQIDEPEIIESILDAVLTSYMNRNST